MVFLNMKRTIIFSTTHFLCAQWAINTKCPEWNEYNAVFKKILLFFPYFIGILFKNAKRKHKEDKIERNKVRNKEGSEYERN